MGKVAMAILAANYEDFLDYLYEHTINRQYVTYVYHGDQLKHLPRETPVIILSDNNFAIESKYLKEFKEVAYV